MEEDTPLDPKLELAQKIFLLRSVEISDEEKQNLKKEALAAIHKDNLSITYVLCCEEYGWELDHDLVAKMQKANEEALNSMDERIKDAEENLGESEVREALLAKALYYVRIGDKDKALEALQVTEGKTVAIGQKMDLVFHILKMAFFLSDYDLVFKNINKAKSLFSSGGDWERKNRLKVYEGLYYMATRDFKKAADLFLDSISTFTTTELFSYNTFIFYTIITSIISLDRVTLKSKVVDAPEVLAVIGQVPHLAEFLNSVYECQYKKFFKAFAGLTTAVRSDRYLYPHFHYWMREVRVIAYSQFLESYKSVTMAAMAGALGVSVAFLDRELSHFIAVGRLNCKIDKVAGILETNRPDAKNALYQSTIKQGDLLLNRIQKLSRVIEV